MVTLVYVTAVEKDTFRGWIHEWVISFRSWRAWQLTAHQLSLANWPCVFALSPWRSAMEETRSDFSFSWPEVTLTHGAHVCCRVRTALPGRRWCAVTPYGAGTQRHRRALGQNGKMREKSGASSGQCESLRDAFKANWPKSLLVQNKSGYAAPA